jgi:chemotaxis protein methyltransferase CheR
MSAVPSSLAFAAAPDAEPTEFAMTAADFDRVRALIKQHAGITLTAVKRAMVYSRLSRRLRETGHASFAEYLNWLVALGGEAGAAERQQFVNCLTTNLTAFFREEHHFRVLAGVLKQRGAPLRIWCNAVSTGEEACSLAMTVEETLGARAEVSIVASDIDTRVLATARRGVYDAEARGLSAERRARHFLRGTGANAGLMRFKPERARLIEYRHVNLMDEAWSLGAPFDLVFCRNVMIYFDSATQRRVLERLHRAMQPEGLLFAGHSENFSHSRDLFRLRSQTVYERA